MSTPMHFDERVYYQISYRPESAVILDAETGEVICTIDESVYSGSWSSDGRTIIASSALEDEIRTYDPATGERLRSYPGKTGRSTISRVDPSNQRLVSISIDGTTRVSDFTSGDVILRRDITKDDLTTPTMMTAAFSPDASRLAIAFFSDLRVEVWDTRGLTLLNKHSAIRHQGQRIVFSDDGDRLYVGSRGGLLAELNTVTGQTKRFLGHRDIVAAIALAPNEEQIVSGDFLGRVIVWDVLSGRALVTLADRGDERITSLDWSSDGRRIVAGKENGKVQIWTLPSP